jgi:hypothetical protein
VGSGELLNIWEGLETLRTVGIIEEKDNGLSVPD